VTAAESGDPLRNARVVLSPAAGDAPLVLTDAEGRFTFNLLPPGTYSVSASKSGYANSASSARNGTTPSTVVQLGAGATMAGVTVPLARGAVISGRILDESGDPLSNANVIVEALADAGNRAPGERWTAQTNDIGEYRVGSLPSGGYVVSMVVPPQIQLVRGDGNAAVTNFTFSVNGADGTIAARANGGPRRLYFPNSVALSDAEVIALKTGEERAGVDLTGPGLSLSTPDFVRAQDPSPIARDANAKTTAAIHGRILGSTGGAISGAEVRISGDAIRPLPPVNTDALGQYEFVNLPPGTYGVSARKRGYITRQLGQARTSDPGERIALAVDERRDRADITLPRTSAITGQVTDEYGDPLEGVSVRVHQIRYVSGRRRLVDVPGSGSSRTDDAGRYRVAGLQPGSFVVAAYVGQLMLGQSGMADIPGYATTYFPGTPNPPELSLVPVPPSQDVESVNFALSRTATATVSGMARTSTGEPVTGGLVLASSRRSGTVATTQVGARIQPDGRFEFPNVPPGQYVIQAYRGRRKASLEGEFAAVPITVNGANVSGIELQMSPGSSISGRVTFDSASVPASRNIDITPLPTDVDLAPLDGNFARADIHNDWTFEMGGVSGQRRLELLRAPRGWGLKRVLVNGIDVTDAPLPFGANNQSLADVEVVLTDRLTEISGTAHDDRGRAVPDARVVVFSGDRDQWYDRSRFVKSAATDAAGAFTVRDLPPGAYFVSAVDRQRAGEGNGEWLNPELLESLTSGATSITLAEGQKTAVNPKLVVRLP
jgi:protocatechuate 3,4-dioxygenase beta subunit